MADIGDVASGIEQENLSISLTNRQTFDAPSEVECLNCGNEIPQQRRAIGGVIYCIECQSALENKQKHYSH